jgi:hypothetical protein
MRERNESSEISSCGLLAAASCTRDFAMSYKLVLLAGHNWDIHVVGGWAQLLKLLGGEDINGDKMDLGVTVLASLGGGHVDDLAWAALDADETVLPQGRALHWVGGGRAGIGRVEGVLMLNTTLVAVLIDVASMDVVCVKNSRCRRSRCSKDLKTWRGYSGAGCSLLRLKRF